MLIKTVHYLAVALCVLAGACCAGDDICAVTEWSTEPPDTTPTEPQGACCEEHGLLEGYGNVCAISEAPMCVGCDGKPVLCMTTGCGVPFEEDCCLVGGRTVTCQR